MYLEKKNLKNIFDYWKEHLSAQVLTETFLPLSADSGTPTATPRDHLKSTLSSISCKWMESGQQHPFSGFIKGNVHSSGWVTKPYFL